MTTARSKLVLFLSKECNSNCPHCQWRLYDADFFTGGRMRFEKAQAILDYYFDAGLRHPLIQAEGEILMYPFYQDVLRYARHKGYNRSPLVTNGIVLHRFHELIFEYVNAVTVSIDGHDHETYRRTRGGSRAMFERVTGNTRQLAREKRRRGLPLPVGINYIANVANIEHIPKMIEVAQRLEVDFIRFGNFHPIAAPGQAAIKPLLAHDQRVMDILSAVTARTDYAVGVKIQTPYSLLGDLRCDMVAEHVVIGSESVYSPCCHIPPSAGFGRFEDAPVGSEGLDRFRTAFTSASSHMELPSTCVYCPRLSPGYAVFDPESGAWTGLDGLARAAAATALPWEDRHA
ncbi:radical SAM protein [Desulfolutivibrio sp.]|uniref:radical SAM protein n=1 Tax=Desulfolutivibrio sp. TaxID=2773296 RepID=UPI002F969374